MLLFLCVEASIEVKMELATVSDGGRSRRRREDWRMELHVYFLVIYDLERREYMLLYFLDCYV